MKLSLNWIKDYVKIPREIDLSKLVHDLTMSTVEVEGTIDLSIKFDKMVVGVIEDVQKHPDADKLRICKTDIGNGDIRDIVCGGTNLAKGMKVAVALPGALVRWHGEGELVEIKIAKLRGVESYGMICASSEVGLFELFPFTDDGEIINLSDFEAKAGTPLATALGIEDIILEIDNKSLTNRPDLWGHYGIAREISALYNLPFNEIKNMELTGNSDFKIEIKNPELCTRYIGVEIEGLSTEPSTFEIQKRIWTVGMRPINSIVDITNYVMLAVGQPTHAFDADHIKGKIEVRKALDEEKISLLNGNELELTSRDLVIANEKEAVALAGIMGGEKDSILSETKKVILEIANFEPTGIRSTSLRYDLHTESATRYEKAIDPERCDVALSLAISMLKKQFPNMQIVGYQDSYPNKLKKTEIEVSLIWLEKRLGKKISNEIITSILERLGFEVKFNQNYMIVKTPSWRSTGDISIPEDILEEVARMHGFENFEAMPITTSFTEAINQLDINLDRKIKEYLAFRCGMQEIFTYPWVNTEYIDALSLNTDKMLKLSTPPSPNECYLRSSHIPNLCKAVSENLRFTDEFKLFESAQIFFDSEYSNPYDKKESLPKQQKNIAGALVSGKENLGSLFRKAKGIIEAMPRYTHIETITFEKNEKPSWADDTVWLNINHNNKLIGNLALLSKKAALNCGIKNSNVIFFEINIDDLKSFSSRTNKFVSIPEYPMTKYDLSLLLDLSVKWDEIYNTIINNDFDMIHDLSFVDEYRGEQVPNGKKSITLRLVIGSLDKTLTSDEIENCATTVVNRLKKKLGAELRS